MRNLIAILHNELKILEAELATDPRVQKAHKIRELLAMYGPSCAAPEPSRGSALVDVLPAGSRRHQYSKIGRMRLAVQMFWPSKDTAALARSRLAQMALTNRSETRSAWLQLQTEVGDRTASFEDGSSPDTSVPSHTPISRQISPSSPNSNRPLDAHPLANGDEAERAIELLPVHQRVAEGIAR